MGVLLGEEWVRREPDPLDVPGFAEQSLVDAQHAEVDAREEQLALLSQIAASLGSLEHRPTPETPVVSATPFTVDTTGISAAITHALAQLPRSPDLTAELAALAKTLDKMDRRVASGALSAGSGGGGISVDQLNQTLLAKDLTLTNGSTRVGGTVATSRTWALTSGADSVTVVQSGTVTTDVSDRAARLLGHVTVDNTATKIRVADAYVSGEVLADQVGAGAVLAFTFANGPVDFIWVNDIGATATNISRCDPFGGTPSATAGVAVPNAVPTPIFVTPASSTVKVYAATGSTISLYGHRL